MSGDALADAAHALVGARFRLGGRDRESGLDCLGVLACALSAIGRSAPFPCGYSLRCRGDMDARRIAAAAGLAVASDRITRGDVLLARCSPVQLHVLVAVDAERFVHAHAGLRRVVVGVRDPAWRIAGHWRLPEPF
jgi:cell wall-associated NlpC family hydrolase